MGQSVASNPARIAAVFRGRWGVAPRLVRVFASFFGVSLDLSTFFAVSGSARSEFRRVDLAFSLIYQRFPVDPAAPWAAIVDLSRFFGIGPQGG